MEYGLRAAVALAREPAATLTGQQIAAVPPVPPRYLTKVLAFLIRHGLVDAARGVGGGYTLSRPAEAIRLLDVVNAIEPIPRITACPLNLPNHPGRLCSLHSQLDVAIARVREVLNGSTLADLAADSDACAQRCRAAGPGGTATA